MVIQPTNPILTQVPRVIHDNLDVLDRPQDHILKVSCQCLYYGLGYSLNKEKRPIVIMPTHPKLTQVPKVIQDAFDVVGRPQGSYPESFVPLSLVLAEL